jgi:hypothetical protein
MPVMMDESALVGGKLYTLLGLRGIYLLEQKNFFCVIGFEKIN